MRPAPAYPDLLFPRCREDITGLTLVFSNLLGHRDNLEERGPDPLVQDLQGGFGQHPGRPNAWTHGVEMLPRGADELQQMHYLAELRLEMSRSDFRLTQERDNSQLGHTGANRNQGFQKSGFPTLP